MSTSTEGKTAPRWVTLESGDGYRFVVDAETVTRIGSTIPNMLAVRGVVLEKALEYLHWHRQHSTPGNNSARFAPTDFERRIPPEMVLELFMSADFFEL